MRPIRWGATDTIEGGLTLNNAPAVCRTYAPFPQRHHGPGNGFSNEDRQGTGGALRTGS